MVYRDYTGGGVQGYAGEWKGTWKLALRGLGFKV